MNDAAVRGQVLTNGHANPSQKCPTTARRLVRVWNSWLCRLGVADRILNLFATPSMALDCDVKYGLKRLLPGHHPPRDAAFGVFPAVAPAGVAFSFGPESC